MHAVILYKVNFVPLMIHIIGKMNRARDRPPFTHLERRFHLFRHPKKPTLPYEIFSSYLLEILARIHDAKTMNDYLKYSKNRRIRQLV